MKVAQYEVLGNDAKRKCPSRWDDRNVCLLVSHTRLHQCKQPIARLRDGPRFLLFSRHFVPGYFRNVPTGHTPKPDTPYGTMLSSCRPRQRVS
jgi:hypothetical protein